MRLAPIVLAGLAAALGLWLWAPWDSEEGPQESPGPERVEQPSADQLRGSACRELAGVAADLAMREPPPAAFLRGFGLRVAGIRPPPRAFDDLARGGRDLIPGRGFRRRFDDGTSGQARHFAGVAVAVSLGGGEAARRISIIGRGDPPDSADGRLTEEAIRFSEELLRGTLAPVEAPRWLLKRLCRRA